MWAVGSSSIKFLLDTGAPVSVVRYDILGDPFQQKIIATQSATFGANGSPLKVLGQITLPVVLDNFNFSHPLIVVKQLSVPGILGADFLVEHKATFDCNEGTLWLGDQQATIPIQIHNRIQGVLTGHCAKFVKYAVKGIAELGHLEGVIEPLKSETTKTHHGGPLIEQNFSTTGNYDPCPKHKSQPS